MLIVSGRDAGDQRDLFVALKLDTGDEVWRYHYPADAHLDYGNSPRATPTFADGVLVALGATGIISGLDVKTGVPLWTVDLCERFNIPVPTWGFSGSPLVVDDLVFIQVAGDPSLVGLDLFSGEIRWQVANEYEFASYASLMIASDRATLIGVGKESYFTRTIDDGQSEWSAKPDLFGDFGVPSPVIVPGGVVFTSENNGVQLFSLPGSEAAAVNDTLFPDSHTPVCVDDQLLLAHRGLHSLRLDDGLKEKWCVGESIITGYASIIASKRRALVTTEDGQLILVDIGGQEPQILDHQSLSKRKTKVLSHPAIHANHLFVRVGSEVRCYTLESSTDELETDDN